MPEYRCPTCGTIRSARPNWTRTLNCRECGKPFSTDDNKITTKDEPIPAITLHVRVPLVGVPIEIGNGISRFLKAKVDWSVTQAIQMAYGGAFGVGEIEVKVEVHGVNRKPD